jgi:outer membrane immunogenic protein
MTPSGYLALAAYGRYRPVSAKNSLFPICCHRPWALSVFKAERPNLMAPLSQFDGVAMLQHTQQMCRKSRFHPLAILVGPRYGPVWVSMGHHMKKFIVASLALVAFAAPAFAADMPVKAPMTPVAAPYNWTGWYVGGHAGYGWGQSHEGMDPPFLGGFFIGSPCALVAPGAGAGGQDCGHPIHGFIGGGQTGYNWQKSNWVFGVEASFSGASVAGTETITQGGSTNTAETKIQSLFLATGRVGYAWDRILAYAKGGYAGASVKFTATGIPGFEVGTMTSWHSGWTVGGGVEYALTANWILGAEYIFADLGRRNQTIVGSQGSIANLNVDVNQFQSVVGRVSYKFGAW